MPTFANCLCFIRSVFTVRLFVADVAFANALVFIADHAFADLCLINNYKEITTKSSFIVYVFVFIV